MAASKSSMSDLTRRLLKVMVPLSRSDERKAVAVVTAYMRDRQRPETSSRFRVFPPALSIEKPSKRGGVPPRQIRVLVADYAGKRNLDFVLDARARVVSVAPYRGQSTFHREEIAEARTIAEADARVVRLARRRGVFASEFAPEPEAADGSRMVGLRYILAVRGGRFQPLARVVVNLSEARLAAIETADIADSERG